MAISVVEFSHGLALPFMGLSVSGPERNSREAWGQAKGLAGKHERNRERSERKSERSEDKERAELESGKRAA